MSPELFEGFSVKKSSLRNAGLQKTCFCDLESGHSLQTLLFRSDREWLSDLLGSTCDLSNYR